MFDVFALGPTGWGDEMLMGAVMTVLVSSSSLLLGITLGIVFAACKLSNFSFSELSQNFIQQLLEAYLSY